MKIRSYKILFRFFSYLSDKTNGASFFVEYKLLLGALIIGLIGVSCNKPQQTALQKDAVPADSGFVESIRKSIRHLIKKDSVQREIFIPPTILPDNNYEDVISCYVIDLPVPIIEDTVHTVLPEDELKESQN